MPEEYTTLGRELLRPDPRTIRRFMSKVELKTFGRDAGCWVWLGARRHDKRAASTPYGTFNLAGYQGRKVHAHRVSYAIFNDGGVPEGMDVDHICLNHWCVNPDHLRIMSREDNVARGNDTRHDNKKEEVPF